MATTVTVLNAAKPGNSLALWLALYQPDMFATVFNKVQKAKSQAKVKTTVGRFADDLDSVLTDPISDPFAGGLTGGNDGTDLVTLPDDSTDLSTLNPLLVTPQTSSGSDLLNTASAATTSSGTSIGSILSSAGTSILNGIAAVGSALSNPKTLQALAQTATAYYNSTNNAQAAAVLQAQLARAAAGQTAAPITYVTNPTTGQPEAVYATTLPNGQVNYTPVTQQNLASLAGPGVGSGIGVWLAAGAAVIFLAILASRHRDQL